MLGLGAIGTLATGTPLAWLVQATSWRAGFAALGLGAALAWTAIWWKVREPPQASHADASPPSPSMRAALRGYGAILRLPHTAGILLLAAVIYASAISLRGLWLGPLLIERHGYSLVQSGNVAFAVSLVGILGPPLFGRIDPGATARRRWIGTGALLTAAGFVLMACDLGTLADVAIPIALGLLSGCIVLQYADVRGAYPGAMIGRAMALFTMAMFLGVALMQWFTGVAASFAKAQGGEAFTAVFAAIAALLVIGALGFALLPRPPARPDAGAK